MFLVLDMKTDLYIHLVYLKKLKIIGHDGTRLQMTLDVESRYNTAMVKVIKPHIIVFYMSKNNLL